MTAAAARVTTSAVPDQPGPDGVTAENTELICPVCHRPFPPAKAHGVGSLGGCPRVYCSPRCRSRAATRRRLGIPIGDRPTPRRSSRRPLPDAAHDAGWKLRKAVERIERIIGDDRLDANRGKVAVHLDGHLSYAADTCARMISQLHEEG